MQEESQKKERCLFAISDYETLKYEWDLSKKAFEKAVGTHVPSRSQNLVPNSNEDVPLDPQREPDMPTPSVADRFLMVQSLASDEQYCLRLIAKLDTVCEVTDQNTAFVNLRETYHKLLADLQKTNEQCAALIGLLPASFAADQLELASKRVKLSPLGLENVTSPEGFQTEPPSNFEEVPWYEQETGIDVDTLEPTMDNLELRVNLLMRRQLREEARQEREKSARHAALNAEYFAPAEEDEEEEEEEEELELEVGGSVELNTDPAFDYAAEWRRLHEEQENDGDDEPVNVSFNDPHAAEVHSERQLEEEEKGSTQGDAEEEDEYYEQYEQEQHDFTKGETDDAELEVAQVVENLVSYVEFTQCAMDFEDSSGSDSDSEVCAGEEEKAQCGAKEGEIEARVNVNHQALAAPEPHRAAVEEPGAADDAGEVNNEEAEEEAGEAGQVGEAEAAAGGIVEVQIVNPPPNLAFGIQPMRFNEPFLHVQHMALAYGYVGVFVVIALVIPALLGDVFFSYTAVGQLLTSDLRRHIMTALDSEESFHSLVKLLEYLEFSTERLEMSTDKELAAQIVLTQVRATMNLAFGYAIYTAVPVLGLTVCYVQYIANIDYSGNAFDVVGVVTRQARAVQGMLDTGVKILLLMIINGVALPIAITFLTAKFLDKGLPPYLRAGDLDNPPVLLIFGLFIFSHLFIAHVRHVLYELRQVINKKYLVGILPDSTMLEAGAPENVVNVHERVSKLTYSEILKNTMIGVCFLLPAFVFGVVLPVRLGHWCFPLASPLMFRLQQVTAEVQIPVEMMLSHIFIPLIVDKLRYKSIAKQVVAGFVTCAAELLQLKWILEPPAVAPAAPVPAPIFNVAPLQALPPPVPALAAQAAHVEEVIVEGNGVVAAAPEDGERMNFAADRAAQPEAADGAPVDEVLAPAPAAQNPQPQLLPELVRLFLVVILGLLLFAMLSSWLLHGPLTTGRWLMKATHLPTHNDLFNYPVGLLLCWGFGFLVQYIVRDIYRNTGAVNAFRSTAKWLSLTAQMLGVGLLWLGLPPLILGVLLEALFVVPLRVSVMETSYFPFLQNWAFGLIILKAFCK